MDFRKRAPPAGAGSGGCRPETTRGVYEPAPSCRAPGSIGRPRAASIREIRAALNVSEQKARDIVREAQEAGRAEFAGRRRGVGIDGRPRYTPVCRMVVGVIDRGALKKER